MTMTSWVCDACGLTEYPPMVSSRAIKSKICSNCGGKKFHRLESMHESPEDDIKNALGSLMLVARSVTPDYADCIRSAVFTIQECLKVDARKTKKISKALSKALDTFWIGRAFEEAPLNSLQRDTLHEVQSEGHAALEYGCKKGKKVRK